MTSPRTLREEVALQARLLAMRLEDAARAGLAAVAPAKAVPAVSAPTTAPAPAPAPQAPAQAPEVRAAAALRHELDARLPVGGGLLFEGASPDLADGASREEALARVAREVAGCELCPELVANRTLTVPGQGSPQARLVFCGEGPGQEEDRQGLAFVGRAGELLTKMIGSIGLEREGVFILNIVKCRPPGNRNPTPLEAQNCRTFLRRQLAVIQPRVIVALGAVAAQNLLETTDPIGRLRGRFHERDGIKIMPTYHPAYVLRNYTVDTRQKVYDDLLKVKAELDAAG